MKERRGATYLAVNLAVLITLVALVGTLTSVTGWGGYGQEGGGKPELHLIKIVLEPPSPVSKGVTVKVFSEIVNTGEAAAGQFNVEFFYRREDGARRWISFAVVPLPGLTMEEQEVKVTGELDTSIPELIPDTTYEIRVVVDSNDQIPELDETNNELITTLTVRPSKLGKPDLQPQDIAFSPPSPVDGQIVAVSSSVVNTGDKDAGPFQVAFLNEEIQAAQEITRCPAHLLALGCFDIVDISKLPVGGEVEVQGALDTLNLPPGTYEIRIVVDPTDPNHPIGQVEEQDEANNEIAASLTVQGPELHPESISFEPSLVSQGDELVVSSKVMNTGRGEAGKFDVGFFINGTRFATDRIPGLEVGKTVEAEGRLKTADLIPGTYIIRVKVDSTNQVHELDEANNEITKSLTIQEALPRRPELHPKSIDLTPTSPVELGSTETVTVSSTIVNTGTGTAEGFDVGFYYRPRGTVRWRHLQCSINCEDLSLSPGNEIKSEGKLEILSLSPGIYEIKVVVDPPADPPGIIDQGKVVELDETNNELVTSLTLLSPRLPDLAFALDPIRFEPEPPWRRGQVVRIVAKILNVGDKAAGTFEVEFSYCRQPEVIIEEACTRPTDFTPFDRVPVPGLGIGKQATAEGTLNTAGLRPGYYVIRVVIDPQDEVEEQNEFNNEIPIYPLIQGPDLTPLPPVELNPPSPVVQGEDVNITAMVVNVGIEAVGKFNVEFSYRRVDEEGVVGPQVTFWVVPFTGLAVNNPEPALAVLNTSRLEPGTYQICVEVDSDDQVEELYEANNILCEPLTILPGERSDLEIQNITIKPSAIVRRGDVAEVFAEIKNIGEGAAGTFLVKFFYRRKWVDDILFDTKTVSALDVSEKRTIKAELDTSNLDYGDYTITVVVDPDDRIKELNEENNQMSKSITVI